MSFSPDILTSSRNLPLTFRSTRYGPENPAILALAELGPTPTNQYLIIPSFSVLTRRYSSTEMSALRDEGEYDYLMFKHIAVINAPPPINNTLGSSGFISWNAGFGFGITSTLYAGVNSVPGGRDDIFDYSFYTYSSEDSMNDVFFVNGYNSSDTVSYIETELHASPYQSFVLETVTAAAPAYAFAEDEYAGDGYLEGSSLIFDVQAVLYKTKFDALRESSYQVKNESGDFVSSPRPYDLTLRESRNFPMVGSPVPKSDGFTGDLRLFESQIYNSFSLYGYVKKDIQIRFKTTNKINEERNEYVQIKMNKFSEILGDTLFIPKEYRTKKQVSPNIIRENYTTFDDLNTMSDVSTTTSNPAGVMTRTTSGGSY